MRRTGRMDKKNGMGAPMPWRWQAGALWDQSSLCSSIRTNSVWSACVLGKDRPASNAAVLQSCRQYPPGWESATDRSRRRLCCSNKLSSRDCARMSRLCLLLRRAYSFSNTACRILPVPYGSSKMAASDTLTPFVYQPIKRCPFCG